MSWGLLALILYAAGSVCFLAGTLISIAERCGWM